MAHDRTASRPESLFVMLEDTRVLAVSATSTTGQKMLVVTFHAPHAQRPHTEIHAWWTGLMNLWQPGNCSSLTLCFWETRMDELDPTFQVLSDPSQQRSRTVLAFCGTRYSSHMPSGYRAQ